MLNSCSYYSTADEMFMSKTKKKIVDTFGKRNGSKSTVFCKKNNRKIIFNFFLSLKRKTKKKYRGSA